LVAVRLYGKNWSRVEEHIGTRDGAQIRSHAQKYYLKLVKEKGQNAGIEFLNDLGA